MGRKKYFTSSQNKECSSENESAPKDMKDFTAKQPHSTLHPLYLFLSLLSEARSQPTVAPGKGKPSLPLGVPACYIRYD